MSLHESVAQSELYCIEHTKKPVFKPQDHPEIPPPLQLGCSYTFNRTDKLYKDNESSSQEESSSPKFSKPQRKRSLIEEAIRVRSRLNSIEINI